MRKSLMLTAAMMISTIIFAQQPVKGKHGAGRSETMKTVLSLDDNQYATIKEINKKYAAKHTEVRKDSTQAHDKKREASQALRVERENEIKTVLTPEQKTKWETYKAERLEKRKERRQMAAEKHESRMKSTLSLSDDQFVKMQAAGKDFKEKFKAQRKDGKADKAEFKRLQAEHEAIIKTILTEQQFEKWTTLKAEKRNKRSHKRK